MRIFAVNGSPRGKKSNTAVMVEAFLAGAQEMGAETETVYLAEKNIKHCLGCFSCWIKTPGVCAIKDDMKELLENLRQKPADILLLATPLYFFHITGLMKNFMDRLLPAGDPHFEKGKDGVYKHIKGNLNIPGFILMSNCGFPEQTHFDALRSWIRIVAKNTDSQILAEIYRGQGELLRQENIFLMPVISGYKKLLRKAGGEIVKDGKLSQKTMEDLEKPLISYDMYINEGNKVWDKMLEKMKK